MAEKKMPRYPIYIPSKGRSDWSLTANFLERDGVPFRLVVEPQEMGVYVDAFGKDKVLELPWDDPGSVIPARNWIWEHAKAEGHERHWQLDDNIRNVRRWFRGKRIVANAGFGLAIAEDFTERYTNVAISGLNYTMFAVNSFQKAFTLNCHVYSCSLILNSLPNRFRGRYNEDTDICLQVLSDGWCTILFNAFLAEKMPTMKMPGGNTEELQYFNDGRARMARSLERVWPGVVETKRRFCRPQHVVNSAWKKFDTQLIRKPDAVTDATEPNEHGMKLKQKKREIKSSTLRNLVSGVVETEDE